MIILIFDNESPWQRLSSQIISATTNKCIRHLQEDDRAHDGHKCMWMECCFALLLSKALLEDSPSPRIRLGHIHFSAASFIAISPSNHWTVQRSTRSGDHESLRTQWVDRRRFTLVQKRVVIESDYN